MQRFSEKRFSVLKGGVIELEDGWITPLNGYQYKLTTTTGSWSESREKCKLWNADIIVYGFIDIEARV